MILTLERIYVALEPQLSILGEFLEAVQIELSIPSTEDDGAPPSEEQPDTCVIVGAETDLFELTREKDVNSYTNTTLTEKKQLLDSKTVGQRKQQT